MPTSRIAAIKSVVATGRRMKRRDGFMSAAAGYGSLGRRGRGGRSALASPTAIAGLARLGVGGGPGGTGYGDLGALLQLVGAVDHDLVARRQAGLDGDPLAGGGS